MATAQPRYATDHDDTETLEARLLYLEKLRGGSRKLLLAAIRTPEYGQLQAAHVAARQLYYLANGR